MRNFLLTVGLCLAVNPSAAMPAYMANFDHSLFDTLLQSYVAADGRVNYEGLRADSLHDLQSYLEQLAGADLKGWAYAEKLAFWINAYNAQVLQQVLLRKKMKKLSEQPELFDSPLPIAKGTYSLNDIERRILRGKINKTNGHGPVPGVTLEIFDPRVHFALSRGAAGSPRLRNFAYTPESLEATLRENSIDFVNSPKHLRVEKGRLRVSSLMRWAAEDFEIMGGSANYLSRLLDARRRPDAEKLKKLLVTQYGTAVFEFDWTVHDIRHAPTQRPRLLRAPK